MRSALLLLVLLPTSLEAQLRESVEVRVLELEATVLDRDGRPVEGLGREDFQVRIGGRQMPVTNFFAVRNGAILEEDRSGATSAPVVAAQTSIPTSLVIFIDEVHLRHGSRKRALEALQRYVRANVGPLTSATLIRYTKHLDVRTIPTEKPGYILAELEKLSREPFLGNDDDYERKTMIEEIDEILFNVGHTNVAGESPDTIFYRIEKYAEKRMGDVDRTLEAMEKAIDITSGFAGRKVLLYVSEGLHQQPGADLLEYWDTALRKAPNQLWRNEAARLDSARMMRFDRSMSFQRVARTAQRARVAVYSFDAAGLRGFEGQGVDTASTQVRINTTLVHASLRGGLQSVADETGGRYIANENDVDQVLARMSEQFSSYYSIGVQPRRGDIHITVRNRPELRVIASRRRPPRTREEDLEQNVRTRLYTRTTENPLGARLDIGAAARLDGQCVVPLRLEVAQPHLTPQLTPEAVELRLVMLNERNDESALQHLRVPFESGRVAHSMTLRVQPQRHVLSLSVANPLSGEASYLQQEIDATACRFGVRRP